MCHEKHSKEAIERALRRILEDLPDLLRKFDDRPWSLTGSFDDLVQEARAAALESLSRFKPGDDLEDSLRSWVFVIAKHKYTDLQRQAGRFISNASDGILEDARTDGLTPSRVMGIEEGLDRLADCLLKLPEEDRVILKMNLLDKVSAREIADRYSTTEGAVWNTIRRTLKELRTCWGSSGAYRFLARG